MKRIPRIYPGPFGGPLYWQDEVTGELPAAVVAYLEHGEVRPLFVDYLHYWVSAPALLDNPYMDDGDRAAFAQLVERAASLTTDEEVSAWLDDALDWGIDPL